jgi:hypothetical protein
MKFVAKEIGRQNNDGYDLPILRQFHFHANVTQSYIIVFQVKLSGSVKCKTTRTVC